MSERAYSLRQIVLYALKLGAVGFGGPIALIGNMHRDLGVKRRWISEEDYKDGLALAQLAPGPRAAQMAMYLGFVDFGVLGATLDPPKHRNRLQPRRPDQKLHLCRL